MRRILAVSVVLVFGIGSIASQMGCGGGGGGGEGGASNPVVLEQDPSWGSYAGNNAGTGKVVVLTGEESHATSVAYVGEKTVAFGAKLALPVQMKAADSASPMAVAVWKSFDTSGIQLTHRTWDLPLEGSATSIDETYVSAVAGYVVSRHEEYRNGSEWPTVWKELRIVRDATSGESVLRVDREFSEPKFTVTGDKFTTCGLHYDGNLGGWKLIADVYGIDALPDSSVVIADLPNFWTRAILDHGRLVVGYGSYTSPPRYWIVETCVGSDRQELRVLHAGTGGELRDIAVGESCVVGLVSTELDSSSSHSRYKLVKVGDEGVVESLDLPSLKFGSGIEMAKHSTTVCYEGVGHDHKGTVGFADFKSGAVADIVTDFIPLRINWTALGRIDVEGTDLDGNWVVQRLIPPTSDTATAHPVTPCLEFYLDRVLQTLNDGRGDPRMFYFNPSTNRLSQSSDNGVNWTAVQLPRAVAEVYHITVCGDEITVHTDQGKLKL